MTGVLIRRKDLDRKYTYTPGEDHMRTQSEGSHL